METKLAGYNRIKWCVKKVGIYVSYKKIKFMPPEYQVYQSFFFLRKVSLCEQFKQKNLLFFIVCVTNKIKH